MSLKPIELSEDGRILLFGNNNRDNANITPIMEMTIESCDRDIRPHSRTLEDSPFT